MTAHLKFLAAHVRLLAGLAAFLAILYASPAFAHGGEDHSHGEEKQQAAQGEAARVSASSELFEIVGIPASDGGGTLSLYVTEFWSNRMLKDAKLEVSQGDQSQTAKAHGDHYEVSAPWVLKPGSYPLTFSVTSGDDSDLLIGTLEIPAANTQASHESIWDHLLPHDFHVPQSFVIGTSAAALLFAAAAFAVHGGARKWLLAGFGFAAITALGLAAIGGVTHGGDHASRAALLDVPDTSRRQEDGSVFLPKAAQALLGIETLRTDAPGTAEKTVSLTGQIVTDPNRSGVVQSLLAGRIAPPEVGFPAIGAAVKKGDVLGYLVPRVELVDQSDIRQTTGDLDRQIALAEAKVARYDKLKGVLSQANIDDAHLELEGLRARRAAIKPVLGDREALTAPIAGVIAQANVSAGQVVDAQSTLFQIVDTDSLYVEALVFDVQQAADIERDAKPATAALAGGRTLALEFAGRGLSLRQQAVPLRYRIASGGEAVGIGQPVTLSVPVDDPVKAVIVPKTSIVRAPNGQTSVLVHVAPERFAARPVATVNVDGSRVGVTAGLEPDVRIVSRGAELINQVR